MLLLSLAHAPTTLPVTRYPLQTSSFSYLASQLPNNKGHSESTTPAAVFLTMQVAYMLINVDNNKGLCSQRSEEKYA